MGVLLVAGSVVSFTWLETESLGSLMINLLVRASLRVSKDSLKESFK